jgi:hypothetical protein
VVTGSEVHVIFLKVIAWWFGANTLLFAALCALAMRKKKDESQADKAPAHAISAGVEQWEEKPEPAREHARGVGITETFIAQQSGEERSLSHALD